MQAGLDVRTSGVKVLDISETKTINLRQSILLQNNLKMKSINNNAPVKCSKTITIKASSEKVWKVMTNINNWATWQTEISNPKLNGELKPNSTCVWKTGGAKITSTLHTVEPNKQFGWTGKTFGMFAIHNWTIAEINCLSTVSAPSNARSGRRFSSLP